jgi:hypothetical protein
MVDIFAFTTHLLEEIQDFVMEQLMLGLTMSQIMTKHRQHVKNTMLKTCELNRDMLFTEQDVKVLFGKLVKETYQLHKKDAQNVSIWVQQNTNSVFYYQKTRVEVDGGLIGQNMPFILGIQTSRQKDMMGRCKIGCTKPKCDLIHYGFHYILNEFGHFYHRETSQSLNEQGPIVTNSELVH